MSSEGPGPQPGDESQVGRRDIREAGGNGDRRSQSTEAKWASWAWMREAPEGRSEFDSPGVEAGMPNIARVYDYWLGGKDNFAADRDLGDRVRESVPGIVEYVRANRAFLLRAVRELAADGVDQFLDLGAGIPTSPNVHEIAHELNPAARVVYVDNDAVVLATARALLETAGTVRVAAADLREPSTVYEHEVVDGHLDWSRPVAVLMVAVLHFLSDAQAAALLDATARTLLAPGAGGGVVVVSHVSPMEGGDRPAAQGMSSAVAEYNARAGRFVPRTSDQVGDLLTGWEYLPPGMVRVSRWRPDAGRERCGGPDEVPMTAVVASPTPKAGTAPWLIEE